MILRVFGPQAPREPLLYLLWMMLAVTISEFGAMRISKEHRTRKNAHTKRDDYKAHSAAMSRQAEFPYRYVFSVNHPFSSFTQFLRPPPVVPQTANDNAGFSVHPAGSSQEYAPHQPEYKFAIKSPQLYHQQSDAQPFSPSSVQMAPIPFQSGSPHMLLLLHTDNAGSARPIQTFMLVPADGDQHFGNLAVAPQQQQQLQQHQLQLQQQFGGLSTQPLSSFGMQPHPSFMHIPTASSPSPMILRPSGYTKSSKGHHYHNRLNAQLLQRPIGVYQMPAGKYYPQKKSSMESKMSASENVNPVSNEPPSTSTEPTPDNVNLGKRNLSSKSKNVQ